MGNISCAKYRPPYKSHVRRVYQIKENPLCADPARFKSLTQYARSSPEYLPSIGRYLLKQIKRDTVVHNTRRIEIGISAFEALLSQDTLPLEAFGPYVVQAIVLMFDSNSPELNIYGLKLLLALITHKEYRNEHEVEKFYEKIKNLCRAKGLASDEICPLAFNTLKEMLRVDDDESIVERLGEILNVIFENIADTEFRRRSRSIATSFSATEEAARACFDMVCLRTTTHGEELDGRYSLRSSTLSSTNMVQNFYTYERLMCCLISFLSSRMWKPQEFCVNIFLRFNTVAKHDPVKICESIVSSMKQVPSGANRLEIQQRILTVVDRIMRNHSTILRHSHTLPSAVAKILKQTITTIISYTEKGKNWPSGTDPNLDRFAHRVQRCLEPMFQILYYPDTLSLMTEILDEWLKKAWNAESYYGVEHILRLTNCACRNRQPFPNSCSPNRLRQVLQLILRFQSNPKLRLQHSLWRNVSILSFQLIQSFLISPTSYRASQIQKEETAIRRFLLSEIPDEHSRSSVRTILEKRLRLEVEECFKLPWFEEFRIYIYCCIHDSFCSSYLSPQLAYSLHYLLIVVMSSDDNQDLRNILMFLTNLQREVEHQLVKCTIIAVLIQSVREILRDAESKDDEEVVNKAKTVENELLAVAAMNTNQRGVSTKLIVNSETGLLVMVNQHYEEEDSSDQEALWLPDSPSLPKEPKNICDLLKPLTQTPTENQLRQWVQNMSDIHTKFKQGSSDEGSLPTHRTLTRHSGFLPKATPSPQSTGKEDNEQTSEENGLENCKSFEDFIEVFTNGQKKNAMLMDELDISELRWENNLLPSIQPDDLVFDVEEKFSVYPHLTMESRSNPLSPSVRLKEIRHLFGNKSKNRTPRGTTPSPISQKGSSQIAGNVDKVFNKLGLLELELERGLMTFELRKEPINILLNAHYNRERRQHFLDEEDAKKGRLTSQVAKFIKKMKKGVQEKKYKSRRVKQSRRPKRPQMLLSDHIAHSEEKTHYDVEIQMEELDGLNDGIFVREFDGEMQDISEVEEDQDCQESESDGTNTPLLSQFRDSLVSRGVIHSAPCQTAVNDIQSSMENE